MGHGVMQGKGQAGSEQVQVFQYFSGKSYIGSKYDRTHGKLLVDNRLYDDLSGTEGGHHTLEYNILRDVDHISLECLHRV